MAKAALKEEFEFPVGGIGDFYMEDDELAALEAEEAREQFGSAGIANFQEVASRMASYGRYGDDTVAHVETGELIVPKALIDQNPKLRESIFGHLRELGVEDPERYVVGSGANSLNPETGLPEFFFKNVFKGIKKAVSGVVKGVKKALKSVVKVVKKVAPVVIPFVLNAAFPGLGAIYSGALGAGIGTLVQGGSLKDAFKNALIGGAIGGATAGVQGAMAARSAGTSMSQGAIQGIKDAAQLSNLSTAGRQLATGQFGQSGYESVLADSAAASQAQAAALESAQIPDNQFASATMNDASSAAEQLGLTSQDFAAAEANLGQSDAAKALVNQAGGGVDAAIQPYQPREIGATLKDMFTDVGAGDKSFFEAGKDLFFPSGPTAGQLELAKAAEYNKVYDAVLAMPGQTEATAAARALAASDAITASSLSPGMISTYAPLAAAGTGIAAASGFFSAPEQEELDIASVQGPTGSDLIAQNPDEYLVGGSQVTGASGPYSVASNYAYNPYLQLGRNPFGNLQYAAEGGEIFPRRTGGIMPDEGIPNQDSVRAMLMPGEFVMTTDAVRGLGNGDLNQGINNMYGMMRNLEARGKGMA